MRDRTTSGRAAAVGKSSGRPAYSAPALEKGLDVLELLATLSEGVTASQIAQRLGRSLQEVYRVVLALERRGYIGRLPGEDTLVLSTKLHDLACFYPPIRRLATVAQPIMTRVAFETSQALHVAVLDGDAIRVIAQVDSPAPLGFRLRVGTRNPAANTASGRVLIAYQPPEIQAWLLETIGRSSSPGRMAALRKRIAAIRTHGYEIIDGEALKGITDISFPILAGDGYAPAVLTMPFLAGSAEKLPMDQAARLVFDAAATVSTVLGGRLDPPAVWPQASGRSGGTAARATPRPAAVRPVTARRSRA